MTIFYNIVILVLSAFSYFFYSCVKNNIADKGMLIMMSLLFALGIFSLIKSFQYLLISKKAIGRIVVQDSSTASTGKIQDIGSYSRGYRYSFLIDGCEYTMPKYFYFGSKYEVGDIVKVSIVSYVEKTAMPTRASYNIVFIGIVAIYISVKMFNR